MDLYQLFRLKDFFINDVHPHQEHQMCLQKKKYFQI